MRPTGTGALLILGMHRSGTSYVGGLARLAGFARLEGPDVIDRQNNPHGHEEVSTLTQENERLLLALDGCWLAPPAFDAPLAFDTVGAKVAGQARAALDGALVPRSWFWKDPRLSLTLDFWWPQVRARATPLVMLVWRHPLEVAGSLSRRNQFTTPLGLALWESYTRHALAHLAVHGGLVVGYDDALDDAEGLVDDIRSHAESNEVSVGPAPAPGDVKAWADRSARHHTVDPETEAETLSRSQMALLELLRSLPRTTTEGPGDGLPAATEWAEVLLANRRRAESYKREIARLRRWTPAGLVRVAQRALRPGSRR